MVRTRPAGPVKLTLAADYRQVHLLDDGARGDLAEAWTVQATEDRIAAAGDAVGLGTERAAAVAVEIHVLAAAPPDDDADWDHVTEAALEVRSGRLVAAGCTDYLPDARRIVLAPGSWRLRASHAGLARGRERLRVQLWPGEAAAPRVVKRWAPAPAPSRAPARRAPRNAGQAAQEARRGATDAALEALLRFAAGGDAAAAASAAEILAFLGRWAEVVPHATALAADPRAVYAGNVFTDMCGLLRRAARELGDPGIVGRAAEKVPAAMAARRDAVLLRDPAVPAARAGPEAREKYEQAVRDAVGGKRFRDKPRELGAHCFALAVAFGIDDEILARWDAANDRLLFDQAVEVARVLARRGESPRAWAVIEERLARWFPVDPAQVAPVALLLDPWISPLLTPERCARVLATPRGAEARTAT